MARKRLIDRCSFPVLLVVPVLTACAALYFMARHQSGLEHLGDACHSRNGFAAIPCTFTRFFDVTLAHPHGFAFLAVFFALVASLLNITYLESLRLTNQPSRVICRPLLPWMITNVASGAVAVPLLLFPAAAIRSRDSQRTDCPADAGECDRLSHPDYGTHRRRIPVAADMHAVPVAVGLGFVAPSVLLMFRPETTVIMLWNLFPLYVSVIWHAVRHVIMAVERVTGAHRWRKQRSSPAPSPSTSDLPLSSDISSWRVLLLAYGLPSIISAFSHILFIYMRLSRSEGVEGIAQDTLGVLHADFWAIIVTMIYWLAVESSLGVAALAVLAGLVGGPGAGLSVGWALREAVLGHGTA